MKTHRIAALITALVLAIAMNISAAAPVYAESSTYESEARYVGGEIKSNFDSETVAKSVTDLQPGDDVTFIVNYINDTDTSTDWYMENNIAQTLERTDTARKIVSGTGAAENGGYTYELKHIDNEGNETVIFSNDTVGGDARIPDLTDPEKEMEGLEPATNAMADWFFIQTLPDKGSSGTVVLTVAFEGETEVNDYMDTDGELNVRFAVEETPEGDNPPPGKRVKTGDQTRLLLWASVMVAAGLLLLIAFFISRRKDRRKGGAL